MVLAPLQYLYLQQLENSVLMTFCLFVLAYFRRGWTNFDGTYLQITDVAETKLGYLGIEKKLLKNLKIT